MFITIDGKTYKVKKYRPSEKVFHPTLAEYESDIILIEYDNSVKSKKSGNYSIGWIPLTKVPPQYHDKLMEWIKEENDRQNEPYDRTNYPPTSS